MKKITVYAIREGFGSWFKVWAKEPTCLSTIEEAKAYIETVLEQCKKDRPNMPVQGLSVISIDLDVDDETQIIETTEAILVKFYKKVNDMNYEAWEIEHGKLIPHRALDEAIAIERKKKLAREQAQGEHNKKEAISLRKSLGITQKQFADLLGTTQSNVCKWERGHRKISRLYAKEIENLANLYKLNLA